MENPPIDILAIAMGRVDAARFRYQAMAPCNASAVSSAQYAVALHDLGNALVDLDAALRVRDALLEAK